MNLIDAIEGTAKCIIHRFYQVFIEDGLEDTEYVRNVKAVIESVDYFMQKNQEILRDPEILKQVLYSYSKDLWLKDIEKDKIKKCISITENINLKYDEYNEYYYDYIYYHGDFPR